jgi:Tol biopolymer transport system component
VIVQGTDLQKQSGLFRVDIETGDATRISSHGSRPTLSPDGREVYFLVDRRIMARDLASGVERVVSSEQFTNYSLSHDGQWVVASRQGGGAELHVFVLPAAGGDLRRIASFPLGFTRGFPVPVAWAVDGRSVFATARGMGGAEIWRVPVDGSSPTNTGIVWSGALTRISVHPDGRRLALSTDQVSQETWVLQNLLSVKDK